MRGRGAVFSPCERYRYTLRREWPTLIGRGAVAFVMLNPSTATDTEYDATIRRCVGFAQRWGFARLYVGNLYALRSTDPAGLWEVDDPVGAENDRWLCSIARAATEVVVAWGANARPERARNVLGLLVEEGHRPVCLGVTAGGMPKHPLRLRSDTERVRFDLSRWPPPAIPRELR